MTGKRILFTVTVLMVLCVATASADFIGPRLEGTATLRSGDSYTGVILTARLGIVDGAEIGSSLKDGGYISLKTDGAEERVQATDIASLQADWAQAGTPDDPKWKISQLTIVTKDGRTLAGSPTWLVHATSLIIELPDGSQKKVYAFPMAGPSFSPDKLLTRLVLGEAPAPSPTEATTTEPTVTVTTPPTTTTEPTVTVITPPPTTTEPTTTDPATTEPATTEVVTIEPITLGPPPTTAPPVVEAVGEGVVLAGEPAVITFVITCPYTGKPIKVKFLIVPLPATE